MDKNDTLAYQWDIVFINLLQLGNLDFILTVWVTVQSMTETESLRSILNHFNSTRNAYIDPVAKQRARDFIVKSFTDHGLHTWTEEFPSNQEKVKEKKKRVSLVCREKANEKENKQFSSQVLTVLSPLERHLRVHPKTFTLATLESPCYTTIPRK